MPTNSFFTVEIVTLNDSVGGQKMTHYLVQINRKDAPVDPIERSMASIVIFRTNILEHAEETKEHWDAFLSNSRIDGPKLMDVVLEPARKYQKAGDIGKELLFRRHAETIAQHLINDGISVNPNDY